MGINGCMGCGDWFTALLDLIAIWNYGLVSFVTLLSTGSEITLCWSLGFPLFLFC
jgi:hypothetical protein